MPLEIERRFLVTGSEWRVHAGAPQHLRQGYLASNQEGFTVRVRLRADGKAWLTLKAPAEGIARHEFEYELPSADSEAIWDLVPHRLIKTRLPCLFQVATGWWIASRAAMRLWCWLKSSCRMPPTPLTDRPGVVRRSPVTAAGAMQHSLTSQFRAGLPGRGSFMA